MSNKAEHMLQGLKRAQQSEALAARAKSVHYDPTVFIWTESILRGWTLWESFSVFRKMRIVLIITQFCSRENAAREQVMLNGSVCTDHFSAYAGEKITLSKSTVIF